MKKETKNGVKEEETLCYRDNSEIPEENYNGDFLYVCVCRVKPLVTRYGM